MHEHYMAGTRPSCWSMPSMSSMPHSSAILPPSMRTISMVEIATCLPVGGMLPNSPCCMLLPSSPHRLRAEWLFLDVPGATACSDSPGESPISPLQALPLSYVVSSPSRTHASSAQVVSCVSPVLQRHFYLPRRHLAAPVPERASLS